MIQVSLPQIEIDNLIKLLPEGNTEVKESDSKIKNKDGTFKKNKKRWRKLSFT